MHNFVNVRELERCGGRRCALEESVDKVGGQNRVVSRTQMEGEVMGAFELLGQNFGLA
jgi:hypothetical protein